MCHVKLLQKGYENQQLSGPFHLAFEFPLKICLFQLHWVLQWFTISQHKLIIMY